MNTAKQQFLAGYTHFTCTNASLHLPQVASVPQASDSSWCSHVTTYTTTTHSGVTYRPLTTPRPSTAHPATPRAAHHGSHPRPASPETTLVDSPLVTHQHTARALLSLQLQQFFVWTVVTYMLRSWCKVRVSSSQVSGLSAPSLVAALVLPHPLLRHPVLFCHAQLQQVSTACSWPDMLLVVAWLQHSNASLPGCRKRVDFVLLGVHAIGRTLTQLQLPPSPCIAKQLCVCDQ